MRWRRSRLVAAVVILGAVVLVANIPTTTRIGIDNREQIFAMPLYQKLVAFVHRDLQMRALSARVVGDATGAEEKALKILEWAAREVRPVPAGFPVVDDHPLHIVIRGYGSYDQAADVFANLAAYAGVRAKFVFCRDPEGRALYAFGLAEIDGAWRPFDVREGRVFRLPSGALASVDDLRADPSLSAALPPPRESAGVPYPILFRSLDIAEGRSIADQMLWERLQHEVRRLVSFGR